ncbi:MAG TPA: enolase C-terminal domain-like protein [Acidimicrobiales bacterium]|nr:enolase C-terminal domain-like protein [Acidimicrobiales bacterium]
MAVTDAITTGAVGERRVVVPLRVPVAGLAAVSAILVHGPSGWGERTTPPPGYPVDAGAARRAAEEASSGAWPVACRDRVAVNALVPAVPPDEAAALAAAAATAGFGCVKVKVGATADTRHDVGRVAAVRDAVGPGMALRVDANGAWDVHTAVAVLVDLAAYDLELAEQPVAAIDDLAQVRRRVTMPVAADECVRSIVDARRLARTGAADAVVVKVQALGGVAAAIDVVEAAGVPAIVSSLYETSVGVAAGLALAAALPELPWACGLGTVALLAGDVVRDSLVPVGGQLAVRRPVPDPALVDRYGA